MTYLTLPLVTHPGHELLFTVPCVLCCLLACAVLSSTSLYRSVNLTPVLNHPNVFLKSSAVIVDRTTLIRLGFDWVSPGNLFSSASASASASLSLCLSTSPLPPPPVCRAVGCTSLPRKKTPFILRHTPGRLSVASSTLAPAGSLPSQPPIGACWLQVRRQSTTVPLLSPRGSYGRSRSLRSPSGKAL